MCLIGVNYIRGYKKTARFIGGINLAVIYYGVGINRFGDIYPRIRGYIIGLPAIPS